MARHVVAFYIKVDSFPINGLRETKVEGNASNAYELAWWIS